MSTLKAVLWDLDGTLIDSEPLWFEAIDSMVTSFGGTWTDEDHQTTIGSHLPDTATQLQQMGVGLSSQAIIDRLTSHVADGFEQTRPFAPGALELVQCCNAAGLAQALVTMSVSSFADRFCLIMSEHLPDGFGAVITGDVVSNGKPHPEPFLNAAEALGVAPGDCVAIEDSPTGVASAMAAGVPTVAVVNLALVEPQPGLSRVTSLTELDSDQLRSIHSGQTIDLVGASVND